MMQFATTIANIDHGRVDNILTEQLVQLATTVTDRGPGSQGELVLTLGVRHVLGEVAVTAEHVTTHLAFEDPRQLAMAFEGTP